MNQDQENVNATEAHFVENKSDKPFDGCVPTRVYSAYKDMIDLHKRMTNSTGIDITHRHTIAFVLDCYSRLEKV